MANGNNRIPERLINFRIYNEGNDLLGVANVDLPEIVSMTDTISGAGIAGEMETPILGHFGSMATTINWRTIEPDAIKLCQQKLHTIDCRGAQQVNNVGAGELDVSAIRASMKVIPKNTNLGSFAPNTQTGTGQTFEVAYLKLYIDDKEVLELDKLNYVANFGGTDVLSKVRSALGLS